MDMDLNSVAIVRIQYEAEVSADKAFNVLHYQLYTATVTSTGLPMATVPQAENVLPPLAQKAAEVIGAAFQPYASEDVGIVGAMAQKMYPGDRSVQYNYTLPAPLTGTVVSQSLPMQDCLTLVKKTSYGQRWGIGRIFVPGVPESRQDGGRVDNDQVVAAQDLAAAFAGNLTFSDGTNTYVMRPVVTNVPTTGFPRINRVVTVGLSDDIIKTQRRRRPGKGI